VTMEGSMRTCPCPHIHPENQILVKMTRILQGFDMLFEKVQ
jgi:hypothetical protein